MINGTIYMILFSTECVTSYEDPSGPDCKTFDVLRKLLSFVLLPGLVRLAHCAMAHHPTIPSSTFRPDSAHFSQPASDSQCLSLDARSFHLTYIQGTYSSRSLDLMLQTRATTTSKLRLLFIIKLDTLIEGG